MLVTILLVLAVLVKYKNKQQQKEKGVDLFTPFFVIVCNVFCLFQKKTEMVEMKSKNNFSKKSWEEFQKTGLLLFVNHFLNIFGWVILVKKVNGETKEVFPARTNMKGFSKEEYEEAYEKLREHAGVFEPQEDELSVKEVCLHTLNEYSSKNGISFHMSNTISNTFTPEEFVDLVKIIEEIFGCSFSKDVFHIEFYRVKTVDQLIDQLVEEISESVSV